MPAPKGHPPYNKNGEGGRPRIYTQEFVDKEAGVLEEWMKDKQNIFIEDFCFERNYHDGRIDEFIKISERFALIYKKFEMKQRVALFKGGLNRKFAHPMCALLLGDKHGIYAKTEQKLTGDVVNPLAFVINNVDGSTKDLVNE